MASISDETLHRYRFTKGFLIQNILSLPIVVLVVDFNEIKSLLG